MFPVRKHRMEKQRLVWWLLATVLYKLSLNTGWTRVNWLISKKVCKRLTRWTNYKLLGSSFFGGQDLNHGAFLPKKVDPPSGVFPKCQHVYKSNFSIFLWKRDPIRKRGTCFFCIETYGIFPNCQPSKKKWEWKRVPPFSKRVILFWRFPSYSRNYNLRSLPGLPS